MATNDKIRRWQGEEKGIVPDQNNQNDSRAARARGYNFLTRTKETKVGSGDNTFRVSRQGMYLGSEQFQSAPFQVDMGGSVCVNSMLIMYDVSSGSNAVTKSYVDGSISAITTYDYGLSIYGDGSDGDIDDNNSPFTLTEWMGGPSIIANGRLQRDVYFNTFKISLAGQNIKTNGYRIYCCGTLTVTANKRLEWNGYDGRYGDSAIGGGAGGAGGTFQTTYNLTGGLGGGNGAPSFATGGYNGSAGSSIILALGSDGVAGGAGGMAGAFAPGTGGAGGVVTTRPKNKSRTSMFHPLYELSSGGTLGLLNVSAGSGGGGGGDGDGLTKGGGGGGAGGCGGMVFVAAKSIVLADGAAIESNGGVGGAGGDGAPANKTGGGGGGGGGTGGVIYLIYNNLTITGTGTIRASGGTFGSGGSGYAGGASGDPGSTGFNGTIILIHNKY